MSELIDSDLDKIWEADLLDRQSEADFLETFLQRRIIERGEQGRTKSYVLNINADWGQGKSFFLDRLGDQLEAHKHLVARVDAWRDDYADDPLLAVMSAIETAVAKTSKLKPVVKRSAKAMTKAGGQLIAAGAKGAISQLADRWLGAEVTQLAKDTFGEGAGAVTESTGKEIAKVTDKLFDKAGEAMMAKFDAGRRSIQQFREHLKKFLSDISDDRKLPLFVLIDELDRCRPPYAISLLERVKHIFEVDNVVFVIATNTDQLQHAIKAVYGAGFDSQRYLRRFFDRSYQMHEPSVERFIQSSITVSNINLEKIIVPTVTTYVKYLTGASEVFRLTLRDTEQCLDILRSIVTVWKSDAPIELGFIYPMIIAQHFGHPISANMRDTIVDMTKGTSKHWIMGFGHFVHRGSSQTTSDQIDGTALFTSYADAANNMYRSTFDKEGIKPSQRYIYDRLANEHALTHSERLNQASLPTWSEYPLIVKTAGRLTSPMDK